MTRGARVLTMFAVVAALAGCMAIPKAEPEDVSIRDQWAAKVPPEVRDKAITESERHTGWGEQRKLQYQVSEFQHYVKDQERKARAGRPTTRRSTTREATTTPSAKSRRAATRGAATNPSPETP